MESLDLLTTGQVARLLSCSRQHVVDLCTSGALSYVSVGTHRRIRRPDAEALRGGKLRREQEQSLWLHRAVAGRLATSCQSVTALARSNLRRLHAVHPSGQTGVWLTRWDEVLDAGPDAVFEALLSSAEWAVELRQNSPFAGVLSTEERHQILQSFREHWHSSAVA